MYKTMIIAVLMVVAISAPRADAPHDYPFMKYDEGVRLATQQNKRIFLYFGRYGCGFCDKTNRESFSDPGLKKLYTEKFVLVYVDAEGADRLTLASGETITEQQLGAKLKTLVTPYFIYMEPDGTPILKVPGFQKVKDFKNYARYINEEFYKTKTLAEFNKDTNK